MDLAADLELFRMSDAAGALPRLGGMARPNGVVIVSERYWAFASTDGGLREGTISAHTTRFARIPLLRGFLQLAASVGPLLGGRGVARRGERAFLFAAMLAPLLFTALPSRWELPAGLTMTVVLLAWLFRGRTFRLHGAEHRAIAAAEAGSLTATWAGEARPTRFSPRCGTNFAALALPVTALVDRAWPYGFAPAAMSFLLALLSLGVSMELWKMVQHPSGLLRGFLIPGLALQRLTTREPALADTRIALRAVASVLRREAEPEGAAGVDPAAPLAPAL
ncbi:MAG: DUF1385 domain-containing protein [Actinomycetota bacterium]|nr:DUF1385 domain-containing protein [Actinomycetota bacterium]